MTRLVWLVAWVGACAGDPGVDTTDTAADPCADAPVLSWSDFGQDILLEHCDTCHAAASPDRYDAPADVHFDTYAEVVERRDRILAVVATDPARMPPAVPLPARDRELLVSWLTCDVPAAE